MKKALVSLLAVSLLAGCGTAPLTTGARNAAGVNRLHGKQLSVIDIGAVLASEEMMADREVIAGLPATLQAPSDVVAQRNLQVLYAGDMAETTPKVDASIDDAISGLNIGAFVSQYPEVTDPQAVAYVQGIADRLTKATTIAPFKVHLVDCPMVNAFNAGGHSMVVFTGILPTLKDEAELAAVMAHEMTHGLKRHVIQGSVMRIAAESATGWVNKQNNAPASEMQLASSYIRTLPKSQQNDADFILSYLQGKVGAAAMANLKFAFNSYFTNQTLTRGMEAEADQGGVRMLSAAGYDPNAMADTFDAWNSRPDGDMRYYNHPALGQRVAAIRAQIRAEHLENATMDRGADRYAAVVNKVPAPKAGTATVPNGVIGDLCL